MFHAECGMNVHHKCENKVGNLCGVNQKLMAEALAMIESTQQVHLCCLLDVLLLTYVQHLYFPKLRTIFNRSIISDSMFTLVLRNWHR